MTREDVQFDCVGFACIDFSRFSIIYVHGEIDDQINMWMYAGFVCAFYMTARGVRNLAAQN